VVKNAVSGLNVEPDVPMVTFPIESFLPDADLSTLKARKHELYDALTRAEVKTGKVAAGKMLRVEAATYEAALTKANHLFISKLWGDGMPLWPATRERVDWMLRGTPLPREHVIGKFPPRGGIATVEACAIALAMTGGRPEYLPILISAVDAFLDPALRSELAQATSGAPFPVVVVNGPIAKQIKLNSGFGCLGPDPQYPAGASIGRALRQMQQNLGGALPGTGTMAPWGNNRYNNIVFAEDEEGLPEGWPTHAEERHGFARSENAVSLFFATGANNIIRRGAMKETKEEDAVQGLHRMAGFLAVPHYHYLHGYEEGTPGAMLLTRVVADSLASLGWSKQKIREFLIEHSRISQAQLKATGGRAWIEIAHDQSARDSIDMDPWPITSDPKNLILVVAGGGHPTHSFWLQGNSPAVIGRRVRVPETFEVLIEEAEKDLAGV
jgi:hypothetical protein